MKLNKSEVMEKGGLALGVVYVIFWICGLGLPFKNPTDYPDTWLFCKLGIDIVFFITSMQLVINENPKKWWQRPILGECKVN